MRRSIVLPAALLGSLSGAAATLASPADLQIIDQGITVQRNAECADFSLTFNRRPDFVAIDGRQPDAFQYEIDADSNDLSSSLGWDDIDAVLRGGEIWEGRGIPVRFRTGDGGGDGGGWGPVRALLPFDLVDSTITFSVPLDAIDAADGSFRYRIIATQDGAMTSQVSGAVVPLPAAVWTGLTLLGGVGAARKLRLLGRI